MVTRDPVEGRSTPPEFDGSVRARYGPPSLPRSVAVEARVGFRWLRILIGLAIVAAPFFTWFSLDAPGDGHSSQEEYLLDLEKSRSLLSPGVVTFTKPVDVRVGQVFHIDFRVCGRLSDACKRQPGPSAIPVPATTPLRTGARIRGELSADEGVDVRSSSLEIQPVLATDTAVWSWRITAKKPGTTRLTARFVQLSGGTDTPLLAETPIDVSIEVKPTAGYFGGVILSAFLAIWKEAVALLAAVGGVAALVSWRARRKGPEVADSPPPAVPAGMVRSAGFVSPPRPPVERNGQRRKRRR